jgi:type IV pilus assembly protein PilQ
MKNYLTILLIAACLGANAFSQQYLEKQFKGYTSPDELVTLSATLPFNQALELLSKVSENTKGKRIVSTAEITTPIGLELTNMPYDKALVVLVQMAGLTFEEKEDVIIVKRKDEPVKEERTKETYASIDTREVNISAVFFEMDVAESRQRGIDWKFLLSRRGLDLGGTMGLTYQQQQQQSTGGTTQQQQQQSTGEFQFETKTDFSVGGFFGEATAMFKFFEQEQLGEIIASPNVTTRDRVQANLQVGQDFSIKQRDFAGNIIEQFFSTGSIIRVTPYIYNEDGINYILLNINVERSSVLPDPDRTLINKTEASTQVIMLDGEETVIGGFFTNEETKIRTGVPFLKDLPWWVLGLRYIFGSDETVISKKELVILIKAELVPTLKERLAGSKSVSPIRDEVERQRQKIKYYQFNQQTKTD